MFSRWIVTNITSARETLCCCKTLLSGINCDLFPQSAVKGAYPCHNALLQSPHWCLKLFYNNLLVNRSVLKCNRIEGTW
jgi:hypothetical protein